jgi:hypothetical protein
LSVSVCAGATVIESPVWMPIGSKFSIEQTMTTLSLPSRITSSSNSFQPAIDSSIRTSLMGDISRPQRTFFVNSSGVVAKLWPEPPSVRDGRMITGRPISFTSRSASAAECTTPLRGTSSPMLRIVALKTSRSSARLMASTFAPISSQLYFARTPAASRSSARFRPVCPPIVGRIASGRSAAMMRSSTSTVSGST